MEFFNKSAPSELTQGFRSSKIKLKCFTKLQSQSNNDRVDSANAFKAKKMVLIIFRTTNDDQAFQTYCQQLYQNNLKNYISCAKLLLDNIQAYKKTVKASGFLDYWILISQKNYLAFGKEMQNVKNFILFGDVNLTLNSELKDSNRIKINQLLSKANVADFTSNINLLDSILSKRKLAIKVQNFLQYDFQKQPIDRTQQNRTKQLKRRMLHLLPVQDVANTFIQNSSCDDLLQCSKSNMRCQSHQQKQNKKIKNSPIQKRQNCAQKLTINLPLNPGYYNSSNMVGKGSNKLINLQQYNKYIENGVTVYRKRKSIIQPAITTNLVNQKVEESRTKQTTSNQKQEKTQQLMMANQQKYKGPGDQCQYKQNQQVDGQIFYGQNYFAYVNQQYESKIKQNQINCQQTQTYFSRQKSQSKIKKQKNSKQIKDLLDQMSSMRQQQYFPNAQYSNLRKNLRPQRKSYDKKLTSSLNKFSNLNKEQQNKAPRQFEQKYKKNQQKAHFSNTTPSKGSGKNYSNGQNDYSFKHKNQTTSSYPVGQQNTIKISPKSKIQKSIQAFPPKICLRQNVGIQCNFQELIAICQELESKASFIKPNSKMAQSTLASFSEHGNGVQNSLLNNYILKESKIHTLNNYPSFGQKKKKYQSKENIDLKNGLVSKQKKAILQQSRSPQRTKEFDQNKELKSRSYIVPFTSSRQNMARIIPKTANEYYFKYGSPQKTYNTQNQNPKKQNNKKIEIQSNSIQRTDQLAISQIVPRQSFERVLSNQNQFLQNKGLINQLNISVNQICILYLIDRLKKDSLIKQLQKIVCQKDSIYTFKNPQQLYNQVKQSKDIYEFIFVFSQQIIPAGENQSIFEKYPWCYFVSMDSSLRKGEFGIKHNMIDIKQVSQISDIIDFILKARKNKSHIQKQLADRE